MTQGPKAKEKTAKFETLKMSKLFGLTQEFLTIFWLNFPDRIGNNKLLEILCTLFLQ